MKKWFITFCAFGLIATQVPEANAASNDEEGNKQPENHIVNSGNWEHYEKIFYKTIKNLGIQDEASLKDFSHKLSISQKQLESLLGSTLTDLSKSTIVKSDKEQQNNKGKNESTNKEEAKEVVKEKPVSPPKPVKPTAPTNNEQKEVATKPSTPATNNNQASKPSSNDNVQQTPAQSVSEFEKKVVELTNVERTKAGLAPLKIYDPLMAVAKQKSQDMASKNYFSHTSPTYGSPFDQMKAAGISYKAAGENIAQGQRSPEEVVQAWMNSEGHRANILNGSFTHIGVGYVENGNYWTQQFIQL